MHCSIYVDIPPGSGAGSGYLPIYNRLVRRAGWLLWLPASFPIYLYAAACAASQIIIKGFCSLCGVSGRCAGCPIMLHYMAASLPAFPGCIASINPAYSVRLSSGSVRGAVCPGVVDLYGLTRSRCRCQFFRRCLRSCCRGSVDLCGVFDPADGLLSVSAGVRSGVLGFGVRSSGASRIPPKSIPHQKPKSQRCHLPEKNLTKNEADRETFDFQTGVFYLFNSQMRKIGATRARVYGSCARYIVTSIPFR